MLPDVDEAHYRELQNFTRVTEISNWLTYGSGDRMKGDDADTVVIGERDTIVAIHRAILKFEAVFWQDKTPQMTSFRNCARTRTLVQSQENVNPSSVHHGSTVRQLLVVKDRASPQVLSSRSHSRLHICSGIYVLHTRLKHLPFELPAFLRPTVSGQDQRHSGPAWQNPR
jgi:hypothetical protein